jgi:uncharacterized protein HemX
VVNWNQPTVAGKPEPEHPTPHLELAAASSDDGAPAASNATTAAPPAAATSDGTARWLGGAGLLVAALALGFGIGALVRGRSGGTATGRKPRQEASV